MTDFLSEAQALFDYTRDLRRDFHRHPELGFREARTAGIVARELSTLGLEVIAGVGKTGVVAMLEGSLPGPTVLVRFDMDALPVQEETGVEYASQNPGVMHACGHDGHTAIGLTVARLLVESLLSKQPDRLRGKVKLVFQPAEEGLGGARAMIADGVLESPRPDYALTLHLWNEKPVGWVGTSTGPVMAASETLRVHIHGKGGHGGLPHTAIDPVFAAAQTITALQGVVSRNVPPFDAAVVSITSVRGGEAFNVIPPAVELLGTIRTFNPAVRQRVLERIQQVIEGVSSAMECRADVDIQSLTPAVVNDSDVTQTVLQAARELWPEGELDAGFKTTVSEDMSLMLQQVPGCYFFVGTANDARGFNAPHHHPRFDIDESAMPRAAALMSHSITSLMGME
jgi:amidohydrolase